MMTKTTELIDALAELSNVWRQQVEVDPTDPYDEGYSTGKHECYGSLIALIRKHGAASGGDSASLEQWARELFDSMMGAAYGNATIGDIVCAETTRGRLEAAWLPLITAALANQQGVEADTLRYATYFRWLMRGKNLELAAALMAKDQYATLRRLCESLVPLDDAPTQPAGDVGNQPVSKSVARRLAVQRGEGDVGREG